MAQLKSSERSFYFFDCEIVSAVSGAPLPTMQELFAIWRSHVVAGTAETPIRQKSAHLLIGDISEHNTQSVGTMLVRLSDLNAPNAVYSSVKRRTLKELKKAASEGSDLGAHVLVSLSPEKGFPNTYLVMIENVPGLTYQEVRRLLNRVLRYEYHREAETFTFPDINGKLHRDGSKVLHKHLPRLEFRGRPSSNLEADLKRGKISGVSLIRVEAQTPVAGFPYLTKSATELRISVDKGSKIANLWDDLRQVMNAESRNFPEAKIAFKLPNQPRAVSVRLDSKTGSPLTELYVESVWIKGISPLLSNSSASIVSHLADLAKARLMARRKV